MSDIVEHILVLLRASREDKQISDAAIEMIHSLNSTASPRSPKTSFSAHQSPNLNPQPANQANAGVSLVRAQTEPILSRVKVPMVGASDEVLQQAAQKIIAPLDDDLSRVGAEIGRDRWSKARRKIARALKLTRTTKQVSSTAECIIWRESVE